MEYQPMTNAKSSEIKLWRDLCFFLSRFLAAGTSAMDATAHGAEALNDGAKALKIHSGAMLKATELEQDALIRELEESLKPKPKPRRTTKRKPKPKTNT